MKRKATFALIGAAIIVIAAVVVYETVPVVRYYLAPITGHTAAPGSFLASAGSGGGTAANPAPSSSTHRLFANTRHTVPSIHQVPAEGGWINSKPLDLKHLQKQGKVILVDFWTYTCINCIRANPFDEVYWRRYEEHGLVIIGVASPEFKVEGVPKNVLIGVRREGLTYPILMDADMKVWRQFGNHFWPGKYLINPQGQIVYHKFGEGGYEEEERVIRRELKKAGHTNLPPDRPLDPKLHLIPSGKSTTEELYAGPNFVRHALGNDQQPANGQTIHFNMPHSLDPDEIYLGGSWSGHGGYAQSQSKGAVGLNYQAQATYVVLDTAGGSKHVQVTLDGKPVPAKFRGGDIQVENGKTYINVNQPRLYYPIAHRAPYGRHTLRLNVPAGVRLYSFTFGAYQPDQHRG